MNLERLLTTLAGAAVVAIALLYTFGLQAQSPLYAAHAEISNDMLMLADRQMLADYQAHLPIYSVSLQQNARMGRAQSDLLADRQMLADYQAHLPIYWMGTGEDVPALGLAE